MYYIGIDGGGTKTFGILSDGENVIRQASAGPSNPKDIGISRSVDVICSVIDTLACDLKGERVNVFAGIAGCGSCSDELKRMIEKEFPSFNIGVGTDADNLVSLCLDEKDGCCVICGTGSVAYVKSGENVHRVGGWGYLLDSGGSGYNIGRDGIEAVLRAKDGRMDATLITSYVRKKLGKHPSEALDEIYLGGKSFIASFAECVFAADDEGDMVAGDILGRNAYRISEYVKVAENILQKPFECVLSGGIVENHPDFVDRIRDFCAELECNITVSTQSAVFGALRLARKM